MATATLNPLVNSIHGKVGRSLVFRRMRGKNFVSSLGRKPDKKNETEAQRNTRTTFREATQWARKILQDPERKAYYQQRAKALELPNAYTAALTDYMRKPRVVKTSNNAVITYSISKPGFRIKEVKPVIAENTGILTKMNAYRQGDTWFLDYLPDKEAVVPVTLTITDNTLREIMFVDIMT